eukprot:6187076-Pleurochrysis_carterae.AAC.4
MPPCMPPRARDSWSESSAQVRPIKDLTDALSACGCSIKHLEARRPRPVCAVSPLPAEALG